MVYIGDNEKRNILPAKNLGLYTVDLAGYDGSSTHTSHIMINRLGQLEYRLSEH